MGKPRHAGGRASGQSGRSDEPCGTVPPSSTNASIWRSGRWWLALMNAATSRPVRRCGYSAAAYAGLAEQHGAR